VYATPACRVRCDAALALAALRDEQGSPAGAHTQAVWRLQLRLLALLQLLPRASPFALPCRPFTPSILAPLSHPPHPAPPTPQPPQACPRCSTSTAATTSCPPPRCRAQWPSRTPRSILWPRQWPQQVSGRARPMCSRWAAQLLWAAAAVGRAVSAASAADGRLSPVRLLHLVVMYSLTLQWCPPCSVSLPGARWQHPGGCAALPAHLPQRLLVSTRR
jgi:hypothetical protein